MDVLVYDWAPTDSYNIIEGLRAHLTPFYTVQLVTDSTLASNSWAKACALLVLRSSRDKQGPVTLSSKAVEGLQRFLASGGRMLTYGIEAVDARPAKSSPGAVLFPDAGGKTVMLQHTGDTLTPSNTSFAAGQVMVSDVVLDSSSAASAFKNAFTSLGLLDASSPSTGNSSLPPVPQHPLPQFLLASSSNTNSIHAILKALDASDALTGVFTLHDSTDVFRLASCKPEESAALIDNRRELAPPTESSAVKEMLILPPGSCPTREATPRFNAEQFFEKMGSNTRATGWRMGDVLLYGEAVSSTQTMLDRNPKLLSSLPTPIVSVASHQLAGRGRGANTWLSPEGCLQFSLLLRLSLSTLPAPRLVFVQYLFGLAVVSACKDARALGGERGASVRLKWPNDIYLEVDGGRKKIGGILVNTSFSGGQVEVIVGCGLNVSTPSPMTSLSLLAHDAPLSSETMLALTLSKFESMWDIFIENRGSWLPFEDAYLDAWMHSDQSVTVTTVSPPQQVRILGITADHGLLRTIPERGAGEFIDLQPDGNSFDLMEGLIKAKK